jgi:hypothetical protein
MSAMHLDRQIRLIASLQFQSSRKLRSAFAQTESKQHGAQVLVAVALAAAAVRPNPAR